VSLEVSVLPFWIVAVFVQAVKPENATLIAVNKTKFVKNLFIKTSFNQYLANAKILL